MTTYKIVAWDGRTTFVSTYTESDAFQQAYDFCGDSGLKHFEEQQMTGWAEVKNTTCWMTLIAEAVVRRGDDSNMLECTLTLEEGTRQFHDGYGSPEGVPFTMWTEDRVYFPACYDGSEWVDSAPRNPCKEVMEHVGGG